MMWEGGRGDEFGVNNVGETALIVRHLVMTSIFS